MLDAASAAAAIFSVPLFGTSFAGVIPEVIRVSLPTNGAERLRCALTPPGQRIADRPRRR
ncbi:hypothetical protein GCM10022254_46480 [Actinomadura meridiana]|uniref:Uncharacterized protein n=1 Tax=Actinomadura meridiana TaxID=559626 RepID=A0ABP8CAU2_9ACTN